MVCNYDKYLSPQDRIAEINVLSVLYKRLSERRQTERRWEDCSKMSEQQ